MWILLTGGGCLGENVDNYVRGQMGEPVCG